MSPASPALKARQTLVLASFGVSAQESRAALDKLAEEMALALPEFQIVQAYTSGFICRKIREQGLFAWELPECLEALSEAGVPAVCIQPSHLTQGEEFRHKLLPALELAEKLGFAGTALGEPLLSGMEDYPALLHALLDSYRLAHGEQLVLLGHGSPHEHNPVYDKLQAVADAQGHGEVHIGVLEPSDRPDFAAVLSRLRAAAQPNVLLAPLLLTGGVHVERELAGAGADSWLSRLQAAGFTVRADKRGLGELPLVRQLYLAKARKLYSLTKKPSPLGVSLRTGVRWTPWRGDRVSGG